MVYYFNKKTHYKNALNPDKYTHLHYFLKTNLIFKKIYKTDFFSVNPKGNQKKKNDALPETRNSIRRMRSFYCSLTDEQKTYHYRLEALYQSNLNLFAISR